MEFQAVINKRRSIRKFKPDPVPGSMLKQILGWARLAPSGTNRQPWRFVLISDPDIKKLIKQAAYNQRFLEAAPVLIICCADMNAYNDKIVVDNEGLLDT